MKVAFFSSKPYEENFFNARGDEHDHQFQYFEPRLTPDTSPLAQDADAVCVFVNDDVSRATLERLNEYGVKIVALRCAGFNNVDVPAAEELGITVVRVPAYSPYATGEHAVALMMALNRRLHRAFPRVREGNFSLNGLAGFDMHGKTVGIIGTGKIGTVVARIMNGFGCNLLGFDPFPNEECKLLGMEYVDLDTLYSNSDIITLHCPLSPQTNHLIGAEAISKMKDGVMLINTSRGPLIDTRAVIEGLKSGRIGLLGIDVYEEEADLFFEDLSGEVIHDDVFARLLTFHNVAITGHQAFFTENSLSEIARVTIHNLNQYARGEQCDNVVTSEFLRVGS